jgi:putative methyltransferase (TIGR04325 family)
VSEHTWMRFFRRRVRQPEIWRGVFRRFEDVPANGAGFRASEWMDELLRELELVRQGQWNEQFVVEHEVLLILIRRLAARETVHIVDFGGGLGATWEYIRRVEPAVPVRYDIIEIPPVVEQATARHGSSSAPAFAEALDERHHHPDIVFVKSALQYMADYGSAIGALFRLGAPCVLLEKFSGVDSDTYATAQIMGGSAVPSWFISIREVIGIAASAGYDVTLRRRLLRDYDQSAFQPDQRMGNARTLLFERRR